MVMHFTFAGVLLHSALAYVYIWVTWRPRLSIDRPYVSPAYPANVLPRVLRCPMCFVWLNKQLVYIIYFCFHISSHACLNVTKSMSCYAIFSTVCSHKCKNVRPTFSVLYVYSTICLWLMAESLCIFRVCET